MPLQLQYVSEQWNLLPLNTGTNFPGEIDIKELGIGFRDNLVNTVNEYNQQDKIYQRGNMPIDQEYIHNHLRQLDTIEHIVYRWFRQRALPANDRAAMFDLLDQVQADHKRLIQQTVSQRLPLWMPKNVSNFERRLVDRIWNSLTGNGNINDGVFQIYRQMGPNGTGQTLPDGAFEDLALEIFASVARLLAYPYGRFFFNNLYENALDPGKKICFYLPIVSTIKGGNVGANASASSIDSRILWDGTKIIAGKGSGAIIGVTPGLKDSAMVDFDEDNQMIPSPVFIGLGHELVHAAHYQRGSYIGGSSQDKMAFLPKEYLNNLEEFLTIPPLHIQQKLETNPITIEVMEASSHGTAFDMTERTFPLAALLALNKQIITEGDLRAEHGLTLRHGHETTANPLFYPKATKDVFPGIYIQGGREWIKRYNL